MFTKYINCYINREIKEEKLLDSVDKLTTNETDTLEWLVCLLHKKKDFVDQHGMEKFGPHSYFTTMEKLISYDLVFPMKFGDKVDYIVPREIEKLIVDKHSNSILSVSKTSNEFVTFDFRYLISSILLIMHEDKKELLSKEYNDELSTWLLKQADSLSHHSKSDLYEWFQVGYDDIFEPIALEYLQRVLELGSNSTELRVIKQLIFGRSVGIEHFERLLKSKWIKDRVNECPFLFFRNQATILDPFEHDDAMYIQGNEWILPVRFQPAKLWNVLQFCSVLSTGQMIHVRLVSELVQKRKKERVPLKLWEEAVTCLPVDKEGERERMHSFWEGASPVVKVGEFVLYEIKNEALLEHLTKDALTQYGKGVVIPNSNGVLIDAAITSDWENQLKAASIELTSAVTVKDEEVRGTGRVAVQHINEPNIPLEWCEVDRLPPVSFQLMSYKENMIARLIRQSQALKLPICIEDKGGDTFTAEIKTLRFESSDADVKTYKGNVIPLYNIRRVAIAHPRKNKKGNEVK
ncbi:hypothetical protein ACERII_08535 [Evansella sp. AB-rgal1]|uniref:hypothetical protein n=1 Tax=Evansella sp. AB-rgal1 TaxID=3242696 RepID=UPI00359D5D1E